MCAVGLPGPFFDTPSLENCGERSARLVKIAQAIPGITASEAIVLATRVAQGPKWTLGFFSNTGVTCSAIAEVFQNRAEALLAPNGLAGQWVAEFFMLRASREARAASGRLWYRMRSILVTSDGALPLPDHFIERQAGLAALKVENIFGLEMARKRLVRQVQSGIDLLSVASNIRPDGECQWDFTLYRVRRDERGTHDEVVGQLSVSGDGGQLLGL